MQVQAYLNAGRWLVDCPKHGRNGAMEVTLTDTEYIAPCCYPGVIAQYTGVVKGRIANVPDISRRATARNLARSNGEIHEIVFPEDAATILETVGLRMVQNQNWVPGESVDFLLEENLANGVVS